MKQLPSFLRTTIFTRFAFILSFLLLASISNVHAQCECSTNCDIPPPFASKISITDAGYWKIITSNGIPNHPIGIFPLTECHRPTALIEQDYTFVIPAYSAKGIKWNESKVFEIPTPPFRGKPPVAFGVAVNGVQFDPAAAEWWHHDFDWTKNPLENSDMAIDLDCQNGHVQPDGGYHYHGFPHALYNQIVRRQSNNDDHSDRSEIVLLGWAFEGNPIYGEQCGLNDLKSLSPRSAYRRITGPRDGGIPLIGPYPRGSFVEDFEFDDSLTPGDLQLDRCNGHTALTPEFPDGVYHYHILRKSTTGPDYGFPYIGRCYRLFNYLNGPDIFPPTGRG